MFSAVKHTNMAFRKTKGDDDMDISGRKNGRALPQSLDAPIQRRYSLENALDEWDDDARPHGLDEEKALEANNAQLQQMEDVVARVAANSGGSSGSIIPMRAMESMSSGEGGGMKHSTSMIELSELAEVRRFDSAMQAMSHRHLEEDLDFAKTRFTSSDQQLDRAGPTTGTRDGSRADNDTGFFIPDQENNFHVDDDDDGYGIGIDLTTERMVCLNDDEPNVDAEPDAEPDAKADSTISQRKNGSSIRKSLSLVSLSSLGGKSAAESDNDVTKNAGASYPKPSDQTGKPKKVKKSISLLSLSSLGLRGSNSEAKDDLQASIHSFKSQHDPLAKPRKSAMKNSVSMSAFSPQFEDTKIKRNISFTKLHVREYGVTLGDNPSCSSGPPIQLSWDHHCSVEMDIDEYETHREPRRTRGEMIMGYNIRWWRLMRESGFTVSQLKMATDQCESARRKRRDSIKQLRRQKRLDDTFGSAGRKLKALAGSQM